MSRLRLSSPSFVVSLFLAVAAPVARAQDAVPIHAIETVAAPEEFDDYNDYAAAQVKDPFEGLNRSIFAFNDWTYRNVARPAVTGYEFIVRPPINRALGNFFDNVRYPVRLLNCLLQGKLSRADLETRKFVVNTLGGLGGFIRQSDTVPSLASVPREDLGQTLGVYGVPHGPYLVVPFFGGYSLRDLGGRVGDSIASPTGWEYIRIRDHHLVDDIGWEWRAAITVTDTMSTLPSNLDLYDQMQASAVDPYLSVRDATRRFRDAATAR